MNNRRMLIRVIGIFMAMTTANAVGFCQPNPDPFMKQVPSIGLHNESVISGIVRLSQATGLALSIEYPLGMSIKAPPVLHTFQTEIEAGTATDVLNELTALDSTFTWQRSGSMINVFPRSTLGDGQYVMNRTLESLSYDQISDVEQAVFAAVNQLPPPKEQIAMMQTGTALALPKPWTTTLHNISIREVLNRIMVQLGPEYGWELLGGKDFRLLRFHSAFSIPPPNDGKGK